MSTRSSRASSRPRPVAAGEPAVVAFAPRPGSIDVALLTSPEDYRVVCDRGYAIVDGIRATPVVDDCDEATGFLRLRLERPWRRLGESE